MGWRIVLGPKSRLPESGNLDLIHPVPTERIAPTLEAWGEFLEDAPPEDLRSVTLREGILPLDLARTVEAFASAAGPVTLVDVETGLRVEVEGGTPPDRILTEIADAQRAQEERADLARRMAPPRVALEPPSFAPGRPEKRFLPPIKTALIAGFVLCWAWWMMKDQFTGCTRREVREPELSPEALTESAMKFAHVVRSIVKDGEKAPEGWIEVSASSNLGKYRVHRGEDGKSYLCDGWNQPIRVSRTRGGLRYSSCGPNGKDEHGQGDDVVRTYPEGSLP